jgi:hypothetical protein
MNAPRKQYNQNNNLKFIDLSQTRQRNSRSMYQRGASATASPRPAKPGQTCRHPARVLGKSLPFAVSSRRISGAALAKLKRHPGIAARMVASRRNRAQGGGGTQKTFADRLFVGVDTMQGPLHPVNGIGVLHQIAAGRGFCSLLTMSHEISPGM